jgi:hypothetical protein
LLTSIRRWVTIIGFATRIIWLFVIRRECVNRMSMLQQPQKPGRLALLRVGLALAPLAFSQAPLAFSHFAAQAARASCGDYVMLGGKHANHSDGMAQDAAAAQNGSDQSPEQSPGSEQGIATDKTRRFPLCNSPNCRRQRSLPVTPVRGDRGTGVDHWAYWASAVLASRPDRCDWLFQASLLELEGHSLPPLRPPSARG